MKPYILMLNSDAYEEIFFFSVIFFLGIWFLYDGLINLKGTKNKLPSFINYIYLPIIGLILGKAQKAKYLNTLSTPYWRRFLAISSVVGGIGNIMIVVLHILKI